MYNTCRLTSSRRQLLVLTTLLILKVPLLTAQNPEAESPDAGRPFAVITVAPDGTMVVEPYAEGGGSEPPLAPDSKAKLLAVDPAPESASGTLSQAVLRAADPQLAGDHNAAPNAQERRGKIEGVIRSVDPIREPSETKDGVHELAGEVESPWTLNPKTHDIDFVILSISGACNADGTLAISGEVLNIGTSASGAFGLGVYASTNSIISTADTLIGSTTFNSGLGGGASSTFSGDVTAALTPGVYYIGAYADDFFQVSETNEGNNTLAGNQESLPCPVVDIDLVITSISGLCNTGGTLGVSGGVQNSGTTASGAFDVGVYASTNNVISTADTLIGSITYGSGLAGGASSTFSGDLTASLAPGVYYVGAYADDRFQVSETNEVNNTLAGNQASLPCPVIDVDLVITEISGSCNTGGTVRVSGGAQNVGTTSSGAFDVGVYASTNSIISTADTRIGFSTYSSGLAGGAASPFTGDLTVPIPPGVYYIGAYVDDLLQVSETDEVNNTLAGNEENLPCAVADVDLVITEISGGCNTNGSLEVSGEVQNLGTTTSGAFELGVYASTNSTISTTDTRIGFATYDSGLGGGVGSAFSGDLAPPVPGVYFIGAYADDLFQVSEANESNNTLAGNQQSLPCSSIFEDGFESGDTSAW